MKIAIYANEITRSAGCGVKTYSLEIINHLLGIDSKNEYSIYSQKDISAYIDSKRANFIVEEPKKRFWAFSVFGKLIERNVPDVVFIPIQIFPFFRKNKAKTVVTVHDVAFLLFPSQFTFWRRKLLEFHTARAVRFSDRIIVPSEATKRDLLRFYKINPDKISVVYHGFSQRLLELGIDKEREVKELTKNSSYVLFVGSIQPRKNIIRLVQAFEKIKEDPDNCNLKLVLCGGKGWLYEDTVKKIETSSAKSDIIRVENADDSLLAAFYRNAEFFVMPSLYEGFGLPVLEAMSFGLPVICANNSSLAEIAGDSALMVDGNSTKDLAEKIKILTLSQSLQAELSLKSLERVKNFSWEKAAKETLKALESI